MAFRKVNFDSLAKFNSSLSSEFLEMYESFLLEDLESERSNLPNRTIAPSSLRCKRKTWFRLKGTPPEISKLDTQLEFTAFLGSAIHENIQSRLRDHLGTSFLDVPNYLQEYVTDHQYSFKQNGLETQIKLEDIPIQFACDGLVELNGEIFLLEIKTVEYESWKNLSGIKQEHIDQIICYCSLLHLDQALVIYIDRRYGNIKCYQLSVKESDKIACLDTIQDILHLANTNIAPEGLPSNDVWCSKGRCPYFNKCETFGRLNR